MNNETVKFYELSDTSTPGLPEENGAISFGVFSNDLGRLYVNNGGGSNNNYLIGESLDKLVVGEGTVFSKGSAAFGSNTIAGGKCYYFSDIDFENKKIYLSNTQVFGPKTEVSGVWKFKYDHLNDSDPKYSGFTIDTETGESKELSTYIPQDIMYSCNGVSYNKMTVSYSDQAGICGLYYYQGENYTTVYGDIPSQTGGWQNEAYKTIDFGKEPQTVSAEFYSWLIDVARLEDSGITIPEEIATAIVGKYLYIHNANAYYGMAKVAEVGNGYITYTGNPGFNSINSVAEASIHTDDWTVRVPSVPEFGVVDFQDERFGGVQTAEGYWSYATGIGAHAEGCSTAAGSWSHAEGNETEAAYGAHSEGSSTKALGVGSHAEGSGSIAGPDPAEVESGLAGQNMAKETAYYTGAHAEGYHTRSKAKGSHSEGIQAKAIGHGSHAEGQLSEAHGLAAHSEGISTKATGESSHAEGKNTESTNTATHAEGGWTKATQPYAHSEGQETQANGKSSHTEGALSQTGGTATSNTLTPKGDTTSGAFAHAEGNATIANGVASHSEGIKTFASGKSAHAEGNATNAITEGAHTEGYNTIAEVNSYTSKTAGSRATAAGYMHAEGVGTEASATAAHAEGKQTIASAEGAHAEGWQTHANGPYSHTEGYDNYTFAYNTHAEGQHNKATVQSAHAEGEYNNSTGRASHTEGGYNNASHQYSHVGGTHNNSSANNQLVTGNYNRDDDTALLIVGKGNSDSARSNAFTVSNTGNGWFATDIYVGGVGYGDTEAKILATQEYVDNKVGGKYHIITDETNSTFIANDLDGNVTAGQYSTSFGKNTLAYGDYSHAGGINTKAYGSESVVFGKNNSAGAKGYYLNNVYWDTGYLYLALGTDFKTYCPITNTLGVTPSDWGTTGYEINVHITDHYPNFDFYVIDSDGYLHINRDSDKVEEFITILSGLNGGEAENVSNTRCWSVVNTSMLDSGAIYFGNNSFISGESNKGWGNHIHIEGARNFAAGEAAHAEGADNSAEGNNSHVEGQGNVSYGNDSHAEGRYTKSIGEASHAAGIGTIATANGQTAVGKYNEENHEALFVVGNGSSDGARSNVMEVTSTMAKVKAPATVNTPCLRNIIIGTTAPTTSIGNDGDIFILYS